jgi:hypothetical protein
VPKVPEEGLEPSRSYDQGILSPSIKNHNQLKNQALTDNDQIDLARNLALLLQKFPELARIIEVWPGLPEHIKAAIKALIQTITQGESL